MTSKLDIARHREVFARLEANLGRVIKGQHDVLRHLLAAFLTGGILLSLEVVWFRFLQLFIPSTHRSFAIMILVVLFGIGAGSLASS
ncbi:MAG: hypothetical protein ACU85U_06640, partial [Gammaproteobacteria bacterium]